MHHKRLHKTHHITRNDSCKGGKLLSQYLTPFRRSNDGTTDSEWFWNRSFKRSAMSQTFASCKRAENPDITAKYFEIRAGDTKPAEKNSGRQIVSKCHKHSFTTHDLATDEHERWAKSNKQSNQLLRLTQGHRLNIDCQIHFQPCVCQGRQCSEMVLVTS